MDIHKSMGTEKIGKLLLKFSVPAMIGMIVNALYNVVDRVYIGRIPVTGAYDIAGVGLIMPVMTISFAFSLMVGMGGSTLISLNLGKKKIEKAEQYLGSGIVYGAILGIFLTVMTLFFKNDIVNFLGKSKEIVDPALEYLEMVALGFPFLIVGYTANTSIRSDGNPKVAMGTLLIGAILNIILDPIFIFGLDMGVKGAGLATIISQFASMLWAVTYFISSKSKMKIRKNNLKLEISLIKSITKLGVAPFFLQVGSGLVIFTLNSVLEKVSGSYAVAAMTIVQGISMFFIMPIFGINQGLLPIAGYNYGAKLYSRVYEVLLKAIKAATVISTIGFLGIQLFSKYFIYVFTQNEETVKIATNGLRLYSLMMPLIGFQVVSSIYFQAIGKPKTTMFLSLSRQVIFLIPLVLLLSKLFGEMGVWSAAPIADFLAFLITFYMIKRELKNLKKLEKETI
ncbi:MAG: MATE family efflux transporter [Fusobacteriaceae bacterium]